ncbi:MAG TPA: hypothetical protein PKL29_06420, partial [Methanothrix sp.]|nr:hypothetical protein [Methanothrix sp.]
IINIEIINFRCGFIKSAPVEMPSSLSPFSYACQTISIYLNANSWTLLSSASVNAAMIALGLLP